MKRKSSGIAVVAVLVGVAVAVTLYIASFGKSSRHAQVSPAVGDTVATQGLAASEAVLGAAPLAPASGPHAETAAR